MEKKTFYIVAGIMTILLVIVITASAIINLKKREAAELALLNEPTQTINPTATAAPVITESLPTESPTPMPTPSGPQPLPFAKSFYDWYVNHPDPLKSGDYLSSGYIAPDFSKKIKGFVARGFTQDPVFTCVGEIPPKEVEYSESLYDKTQSSAMIAVKKISEEKPLYKILLIKEGEKWLVNDVRCAK